MAASDAQLIRALLRGTQSPAAERTAERTMTVAERFDTFLANLLLTAEQVSDGDTKHRGVRRCLNRHYYGQPSETGNSLLVGSWGKDTTIRPPRDIDVLFELPASVYHRFETRPGNKQSQLLQEVKSVLLGTYPGTDMRGDGQVVVVPFASYALEVVPAFLLTDGQYWICDTNGGGRYKTTHPKAEIAAVAESDQKTNGNTRALIRMMKRWQEYCSVPLKSFWLELLAIEFLTTWPHAGHSSVYYDWMVRDFFGFLVSKAGLYVFVPGTWDLVWLGDAWKSRAESAQGRAKKACELEGEFTCLAGDEWQKVFGALIPMC